MAKVRQRTWTVPGQRTKRRAWGFGTAENGKQVRQFRADWTKEQAEAALAERLLKVESPKAQGAGMTFGQAIEEYCRAKARKKSLATDRRYLNELRTAFGADTPLAEITAARIHRWKNAKLAATCARTGRPAPAAAVNRPEVTHQPVVQRADEQQSPELSALPE